jgi:N-acetylmuramoyl-L-alanine amidase
MMRSVRVTHFSRLAAALLALIVIIAGSLFVGVSCSNYITPAGIIIHHSAVPFPPGSERNPAKFIDEVHRDRGFSVFYWGRFYHIGYHYVILPDGTVQEGRPEHCHGAHAAGYNSYIGICLIGNFSSTTNFTGNEGPTQITQAQFEALTRLCRQLQGKYDIPIERIHRHIDVNSSTECPGDQFPFEKLLSVLRNSL